MENSMRKGNALNELKWQSGLRVFGKENSKDKAFGTRTKSLNNFKAQKL